MKHLLLQLGGQVSTCWHNKLIHCVCFPAFLQGPGYEGRKLVGSLGAKNRFFDFEKLAEVTRVVTANLNKIIDVNYYPTETARRSNMRHRPIGLGVQVGTADGLAEGMQCFDQLTSIPEEAVACRVFTLHVVSSCKHPLLAALPMFCATADGPHVAPSSCRCCYASVLQANR
jgi:hypothetical protein